MDALRFFRKQLTLTQRDSVYLNIFAFYVLIGLIVIFIFCIPISLFNYNLPDYAKIKTQNVNQWLTLIVNSLTALGGLLGPMLTFRLIQDQKKEAKRQEDRHKENLDQNRTKNSIEIINTLFADLELSISKNVYNGKEGEWAFIELLDELETEILNENTDRVYDLIFDSVFMNMVKTNTEIVEIYDFSKMENGFQKNYGIRKCQKAMISIWQSKFTNMIHNIFAISSQGKFPKTNIIRFDNLIKVLMIWDLDRGEIIGQ